jgi:hypothetical protein
MQEEGESMYTLTIETNPEKTRRESFFRTIDDMDKLKEYCKENKKQDRFSTKSKCNIKKRTQAVL